MSTENLPYTIFPSLDDQEMALRTIPDVTEPKEKSEKEQEIETVLNQVSSGLVIPLGKGVTCDRN